ncbi:MAG: precorrin-6y C5,15-methyltransferase (decarboxylating) subunit CbiE [Clostridiales bacterium]|nr:precorrin-6y C5,15-methyltransferase (decarboxylating) subunit CbiE [Clostridiales bacterium]MCF8022744.1 precorrin-6y C5,15-methyltransferase (decarboxylating) subunit CbiE [Clostridiales bacterium]
MAESLIVVGTGPGHPAYLTGLGKEKISGAEVLIGGKRLLDTFAGPEQEKYIVDRDLAGVVNYIKNNYKSKKLVVLVSGDTGIYSLAAYLAKKLPLEIMEFVPGVSSVQLMFARLKKPWQDASVISLHGRAPEGVDQLVESGNTVAVLTGSEYSPSRVAEYLLNKGCRDRPVAVGKNLSYAGEELLFISLQKLAEGNDDTSPSVMVINYE